jgi:hypothetical protein
MSDPRFVQHRQLHRISATSVAKSTSCGTEPAGEQPARRRFRRSSTGPRRHTSTTAAAASRASWPSPRRTGGGRVGHGARRDADPRRLASGGRRRRTPRVGSLRLGTARLRVQRVAVGTPPRAFRTSGTESAPGRMGRGRCCRNGQLTWVKVCSTGMSMPGTQSAQTLTFSGALSETAPALPPNCTIQPSSCRSWGSRAGRQGHCLPSACGPGKTRTPACSAGSPRLSAPGCPGRAPAHRR